MGAGLWKIPDTGCMSLRLEEGVGEAGDYEGREQVKRRDLRMKELPREPMEGDGGCVAHPDWLRAEGRRGWGVGPPALLSMRWRWPEKVGKNRVP